MQWIIYPLVGLLAINVVIWIAQGVIVGMGGGAHFRQDCPPDVPKFLCGTPADGQTDAPFLSAVEGTGRGGGQTGGNILTATTSAIANANSVAGFVVAICVVDYAILNGDPTGQSQIAGYFLFVGWILQWAGRLLCVIIILALIAPLVARAIGSFI